MEHNQDIFDVAAVVAGPDPDSEQLFIINEMERIDALIEAHKGKHWLAVLAGRSTGPSLARLKHYRHQLTVYGHAIDRYTDEMTDGKIPFRIIVTNMGPKTVKRIGAKVRVQGGTILLTKRPPERPERVDTVVQHVTEKPSYNLVKSLTGGFIRSDIRLGRTSLSSKFSQLESGEEAALVNQTLFLHLSPDTRMSFELEVAGQPTQSGMVQL
jgi:hypothetical protein